MYSLKVLILFVVYSVSFIDAANFDVINNNLVNKDVDRSIDLTSQLAKITARITIRNDGKEALKTFLYAIEQAEMNTFSYIRAKEEDHMFDLKVAETKVQGQNDKVFWRIELSKALQPAKTLYVEIDTVFSKALLPYPASITQQEHQLVRYYGNHYFFSPYSTTKQRTRVLLPSRNVESYTKLKPVSQTESTLTYGSYENVPPFSVDQLMVHFENHSPFLTVTHLERVIELSHWGNIAVEETIDIVHSGALLKGSFSRYDYQKDSRSGLSSVKSYKTLLPASATGAYYRDTNGNISTSNMRVKNEAVELTLRPRYPLFGGWKTHYTLGYNVPSYEYLFNAKDSYILKMRVIDHIFDDMIIDEARIKVILPEGCKDIKLIAPYSVAREADTLHSTYLDTTGRPVVSFIKKNLVENHIKDFELHYTFTKWQMFLEPLLVVFFLFGLFLLVIVYVRLDFSIHKDQSSGQRADHQHRD